MREIKFRAWDEHFREMLEVSQLWLDEKSPPWGVEVFEGCKFHEMKDIILMQYTGLNDKNGKEIYEGDIIIFAYEEFYRIITWGKLHSESSEWAAFYASNMSYEENVYSLESPILLNSIDAERMEVIGNIYENPELPKE